MQDWKKKKIKRPFKRMIESEIRSIRETKPERTRKETRARVCGLKADPITTPSVDNEDGDIRLIDSRLLVIAYSPIPLPFSTSLPLALSLCLRAQRSRCNRLVALPTTQNDDVARVRSHHKCLPLVDWNLCFNSSSNRRQAGKTRRAKWLVRIRTERG